MKPIDAIRKLLSPESFSDFQELRMAVQATDEDAPELILAGFVAEFGWRAREWQKEAREFGTGLISDLEKFQKSIPQRTIAALSGALEEARQEAEGIAITVLRNELVQTDTLRSQAIKLALRELETKITEYQNLRAQMAIAAGGQTRENAPRRDAQTAGSKWPFGLSPVPVAAALIVALVSFFGGRAMAPAVAFPTGLLAERQASYCSYVLSHLPTHLRSEVQTWAYAHAPR